MTQGEGDGLTAGSDAAGEAVGSGPPTAGGKAVRTPSTAPPTVCVSPPLVPAASPQTLTTDGGKKVVCCPTFSS